MRIEAKPEGCTLFPFPFERDRGGEQLARALAGRRFDARHDGDRDRQGTGLVAVEVQVHDIFPRDDPARVGDLIVEPGKVGTMTQIITQEVEEPTTLV